jgi:RNA-directed DNA polymerase
VASVAEHCKRRGFKSLFGFREHLGGLIAHAQKVEPKLGSRYRENFEKISWPVV